MSWLLKLLGSGIVSIFGDAILKPVLAYLGQKSSDQLEGAKVAVAADRDVAIAQVGQEIEANKVRAQLAPQFHWLINWVYGVAALHYTMVMLDSTFTFGTGHYGNLGVPVPPPPYGGMEVQIILSFFALHIGQSGLNALTTWLHK